MFLLHIILFILSRLVEIPFYNVYMEFILQVYGPESTQRQIFDGTTKALVKDVLGGENSLVFTYGVTNAGKTFTFLGVLQGFLLMGFAQLFCSEETLYIHFF